MLNLYYRGYVIHQDIRSICYTIYGQRPERPPLASSINALASMQWIDGHVGLTDASISRRRSQGLVPSSEQRQPIA